MPVYVYDSSAKHLVADPKVYDLAGAKRDVMFAFVYDGAGAKHLAYARKGVEFDVPAVSWDRVSLSWTPPGFVPSRYDLYRTSGTPTLIHTGPETTYVDTGRSASTSYSYRVEAWYGGQKLSEDTVAATTPSRGDMGLVVVSAVWNQVVVSWSDVAGGADFYRVLRGPKGGAQTVVVPSTTSKTYTDTTVVTGTAYTYTVEAVTGSTVVGTDSVDATPPDIRDLGLSATRTWDSAVLTWTDPDAAGATYDLYRGTTKIGNAVTAKTFNDSYVLLPSTSYTYKVDAIRGGTVKKSDTVAVTTTARPAMTLTGTAVNYHTVNLTWTDNAGGSPLHYDLYRGATKIGASISSATRTFQDTGAAWGTANSYTLQAVRTGVAYLEPTATTSVTTPARPTATVNIAPAFVVDSHQWRQSSGPYQVMSEFWVGTRDIGVAECYVSSVNMRVAGATGNFRGRLGIWNSGGTLLCWSDIFEMSSAGTGSAAGWTDHRSIRNGSGGLQLLTSGQYFVGFWRAASPYSVNYALDSVTSGAASDYRSARYDNTAHSDITNFAQATYTNSTLVWVMTIIYYTA